MSRPGKAVVAQSGGPTPVSNASLRGIWTAGSALPGRSRYVPRSSCRPTCPRRRGSSGATGTQEPVRRPDGLLFVAHQRA